jgi:hypothetical protein
MSINLNKIYNSMWIHTNVEFTANNTGVVSLRVPFNVNSIKITAPSSVLTLGASNYYIESNLISGNLVGRFSGSENNSISNNTTVDYYYSNHRQIDNEYEFTVYDYDGSPSEITGNVLISFQFIKYVVE